ncbi:ABC transporter substrate-binding protein [Clostridium saccharobutylicum]|uniref:Fe(3+)-citrate-binding protein YfmC n=1 Tax=Clostridium saccharobutylicum TaxID=169679 RepID=A0A1S8N1Q1_CLOSA|nr:Fe(3+) dicitrate ABC transporter substrate-binding protein [Clostridium saccharobutylicum]OOM10377.1 Fe(3+)-citrate-binding protein YfmC precursor [Clostridium saccharobutylicum]
MKNLRKIFSVMLVGIATASMITGCSSIGGQAQKNNANDFSSNEKVVIKHEMGETELLAKPKRIVTLEYSFVDSLAALNIKPVGIADDNKSDILIKSIADKVGGYTSVGTRSQPNLEVISSLKPDLIIADLKRHKAIYEELSKIAPTIVLKSLESSYDENISSFKTVAEAVGEKDKAEARIKEHNDLIDSKRTELAFDSNKTVLSAALRDTFNAHASSSFDGQLLEKIGMKNAIQNNDSAYAELTLEQLVQINPDVLLLMKSEDKTILEDWQENPLWKDLNAVKNNQVFIVDRNLWTRFRGVISGEEMIKEAVSLLKENK